MRRIFVFTSPILDRIKELHCKRYVLFTGRLNKRGLVGMSEARKAKKLEREAFQKIQAEKRQQEDRRSMLWIYGVGAFAFLLLIGSVTVAILSGQREKSRLESAAAKPIAGVQTVAGFTRNHTSKRDSYLRVPPMGGDHASNFTNCGIYLTPVDNWRAVHSLEHGAVWITYRPDLPKNQIAMLINQAKTQPYEILSPFPGLPASVVASAWGKQLKIESDADPRLPVFLQAYIQGPQTPEVGAACTGGVQG